MKIRIEDYTFGLVGVNEELVPSNIKLFATDEEEDVEMTYTFPFVSELPYPNESWHLVFNRYNMRAFRKEYLEYRILSTSSHADAYAAYEETDTHHANIYYLKMVENELPIDTVFNSCLALERHFARKNCYILHCAHLCYRGMSILFSGPSGIGKSTQADIWCKHIEGTHVVNGDRCLIRKNQDGTFEACGWPVCGSSEICHVEHYPLLAIVFVEQTRMNQIIPERPMDYFKRIAAQLTINHWDTTVTNKALDFVSELASKVQILTYGCNMNPDAAFTLQQAIGERAIT